MTESFAISRTDEVVRVEFTRPDKRNALDAASSRALTEVMSSLTHVEKPIVFRSATPGMFVAGPTWRASVIERSQRALRG